MKHLLLCVNFGLSNFVPSFQGELLQGQQILCISWQMK